MPEKWSAEVGVVMLLSAIGDRAGGWGAYVVLGSEGGLLMALAGMAHETLMKPHALMDGSDNLEPEGHGT